jgi:hypothetical protein
MTKQFDLRRHRGHHFPHLLSFPGENLKAIAPLSVKMSYVDVGKRSRRPKSIGFSSVARLADGVFYACATVIIGARHQSLRTHSNLE